MHKREKNDVTDNVDEKDFLEQMKDTEQWVLFLGDGISCSKPNERRENLFQPIHQIEQENKKRPPYWEALCQAANQGDIMQVSSILFGDIWDGVSFLGDKEEMQRKNREAYAKTLAKKEEIDLAKSDNEWKQWLPFFPYMVITTCQDETIEAQLEYEWSMPVDEMVCTPYIMTTSSTWDRWIKKENGDLKSLYSAEKNMLKGAPVLVKLYGSRSKPHRLLLSKDDMDQYYPPQPAGRNARQPLTERFLEMIFETKNILFIGVNFDENHVLPLAKGIKRLLRKKPNEKKRYMLAQKGVLSEEAKKRYHIETISFDAKICQQEDGKQEAATVSAKNQELSPQDILELFGKQYIRRPLKGIFPDESESGIDRLMNKEITILKRDILKLPDDNVEAYTRQKRRWDKDSVKKLAIAANNLADFYDLKEVFIQAQQHAEGMEEKSATDFYHAVVTNIFSEKLIEIGKSGQLQKILRKYKNGFPYGFLQLLSKGGSDEKELEEWKKASIQLTNSGIYYKHNHRKNVQKRLSYADSVMLTAGTYPQKKRELLQYKMQESCKETLNSFFYSEENDSKAEEADKKVDDCFQYLFVNLGEIIANRTKNYQQVHALLQTEMDTLFKIAISYEDPDFIWKPALYYGMLADSHMYLEKPDEEGKAEKETVNEKTIQEEIETILNKLENKSTDESILKLAKDQTYLEAVLKLRLAKIIMMSKSLTESKEYEDAISECSSLEEMITYISSDPEIAKERAMCLFLYQMQLYVIEQKIYSRRCMVIAAAIETNKKADQLDAIRTAMEQNLEKMDKELNRAQKTSHVYQQYFAQYNLWLGEYCYKCELYDWIVPKKMIKDDLRSDEKSVAEIFYNKALQYYNGYPQLYEIEQADVLRRLADLHCLSARISEKAKTNQKKFDEYVNSCYDMLFDAYIRYRNNFDLHGIADVLCSMHMAEGLYPKEENRKHRNADSFIKLAADLYEYLNDTCSRQTLIGRTGNAICDERNRRTIGNQIWS